MQRPIAPQWETPGSRSKGSVHEHNRDFGSIDAGQFAQVGRTQEGQWAAEESDVDTAEHINRQVLILRENLKKIQLHMN